MKCQHCGKNEATVFFHSNINGKIENQNLCQECAEKLGVTQRFNQRQQSMMNGFRNFFNHDGFFLPSHDNGAADHDGNQNRGLARAGSGNWLDSFFTPMPSLMSGFFDNPFDDFFDDFPALGAIQYVVEPEQDTNQDANQNANMNQDSANNANINANANTNTNTNTSANINANANAPESRFAKARRLNSLRHEMKQAIKAENFERAAQIRDELRQLESQG